MQVSPPRTLITGGVRSGKSKMAERLLENEPAVTYLAPGQVPDRATDPEWADRIDAHRRRRPAHWTTLETADLATGISTADGAVLIDCLGSWVTAVIDGLGTWDEERIGSFRGWTPARPIVQWSIVKPRPDAVP